MSLDKVGIELTLEGQSNYIQGLKEASSALRLLEQQSKTAVAALGNNASKSDTYKTKMKGLGNSYKVASDKLKTLTDRSKELPNEQKKISTALDTTKKALDNSKTATDNYKKKLDALKKAGKANTDEAKRLRQEYSKSKTETKNLQGEVKKLSSAYETSNKELKDMPFQLEKAKQSMFNLRNEAQALHKEYRENGGRLADTSQKFSDFANSANKVGDGFSKAGSFMTRNFTVPVVAGLGYVIKKSADFEEAMSKTKAITKANDTEFKALRDSALDLGAKTKYSALEVADAQTEMGKAGFNAQQIIKAMPGVLDAAAASGEDLASASTAIVDALTGFKLPAEDASRVADVMTQAANSGTIGFNDLAESFKYVAPVAQSMGFSIEDTATALTAMSKSGIKGSQAGTSLKNTFLRMASPTKEVAGAMKDLGIEIADSNGKFKPMNEILGDMRKSFSKLNPEQKAMYAEMIAGKEAVPGLLSLLNMSQTEYDELTSSMNNAKGVAKETAEVMQNNVKAKWEQFTGAVETLAIRMGDSLLPALTGIVEGLGKFADNLAAMPQEDLEKIIKWGLRIAAMGPTLSMIGKIANGLGTLGNAASWVTKTFGKWTTPKDLPGFGKDVDSVGGKIDNLGGKAGTAGRLLSKLFTPQGLAVAATIRAIALVGKAIKDKAEEPMKAHKKAVEETNGAYQKWFDSVTKGAAEAKKGIEDVTKAQIDASKRVMKNNVYTQRMQDAMFSSNMFGGNKTTEVDIGGTLEIMEIPNIGKQLRDMQMDEATISTIQEQLNRFSTMYRNSLMDIGDAFKSQTKITHEWANGQIENVKSVTSEVKNALTIQKDNQIATLNNMKENTKMEKAEYDSRLKTIQDTYSQKMDSITQAENNIQKVLSDAANNGKALSKENVLSLVKDYQTLAKESGKSMSEMEGASKLLGESMQFIIESGSLSSLKAAGIINQSTIDAIKNADSMEQKVKLLQDAIDGYNKMPVEEKKLNAEVLGQDKLTNIINSIQQFTELKPETKEMIMKAKGGEEVEKILRDANLWDTLDFGVKKMIIENETAIANLNEVIMQRDLWNNTEFVAKLAQIDTTAPTAKQQIADLINEHSAALGLPPVTIQAEAPTVPPVAQNVMDLVNQVNAGMGIPPINISATETGVSTVSSQIDSMKTNAEAADGKNVSVVANAVGAAVAAAALVLFNNATSGMESKTATATANESGVSTTKSAIDGYNTASSAMTNTSATATTSAPTADSNAASINNYNYAADSMGNTSATASTYAPNADSNAGSILNFVAAENSLYNKTAQVITYYDTVYRTFGGPPGMFATGGHVDMFADGGGIKWGGMFANGSNVPQGYAGIVGEAGPELFQVSRKGVNITPLSTREKMKGIGGILEDLKGSNQPIVNVNFSLSDIVIRDERDIKSLAAEIGKEIASNMNREKIMKKGSAVGFA